MRRLFAIIVAAIALVGCLKDNITVSYQTDQNEIYHASFEEFSDDTRTYVDEDVKLLWHEDDRISLFRTTLNEQFKFTGATGDNSGGFSVIPSDEWVTGNAVSTNYAVYPYDATTKLSNDEIIQLTMPAVQHYAENSFGRGANTMVAAAENISSRFLPFRNLCGYIIVKLYGEDTTIKSIEFKGNNNEIVAGAATAEAKYGYLPVIAMSESGTTTITLDCGEEGVTISSDSANPTSFWFVVPPITFEDGFTFTIKDINDNTFTKSTTKSQTVVRNEVKPMSGFEPTFEGEGEEPEVAPKPANNEIWYTNGSSTQATTPSKTDVFGANIVSNTYDTEKECWVIKFDGEVTSIGSSAFSKCSGLTSITIPDSVTSIGEKAFYNCSSLTSITIPDSVTTIGSSAFYNCSSLTSITIPDSVTSIGSSAFLYCTGELIVNCNIPSASGYKYGAFYYSEFTKVTIGDGVTSIGDYSFYGCSNLTSITIPDSVTSIGSYAFSGCSSLTSVTIPDSVTSIGSSAFSACSSLTSVTIPDSVTSIGSSAFSACSSLTSVTIPDSVTKIGRSTFSGCSSLTTITIPNSVTSIESYAFSRCSSLTSATIGDSVTSIGNDAFWECTSLTSITIPDSVTTIGSSAFEECSSLTSITIPDSVTSIGSSAFSGCSSLIEFKGGYASEDGRCLIIDGTLISFALAGLTEYTIPDSVTSIGDYAFRGCGSLTSVTIPDSVTSIGYRAFYRCAYITSITIPDSVTFIGNYAFECCFRLKSVYCKPETPPITVEDSYMFYENDSDRKIYVPIGSVESYKNAKWWSTYAYAIEGYNFAVQELSKPANNEIYYTNGSTTEAITPNVNDGFGANIVSNTYNTEKECWVIKFDGIVTKIGDSAFYSCKNLISIIIPDSVTSIGTLAFGSCSSLTSPIILDSVTTIGDRAFSYCRSLTTVTIPDSVTTIKWETFRGCSSLASVTIPNSVTLIDFRAFYECSSLTSITIPNSVTSIRENTFGECSSLNGITIPNSVTEIRGGAFIGCHNLEYVNLPNSLTTIGSAAFRWCISLTGIIIPESVTSIGELAFDGCYDLTTVRCEATTPPTGGSGMFYSYSEDEYLWPHIYVPYNSVSAYKSAEYWKDYASQISADPLSAY